MDFPTFFNLRLNLAVSYSKEEQWIISWLDCGFYTPWRHSALSLDEKNLQSNSQSQLCTKKKVMVTVQWSAIHLIHYSFLHLSERLYLRSLFNKLMRCTENSKICRHHWSTKEPTILHDSAQLHMPQLILPELKELVMKFCLICHVHLTFCQLATISLSISTIFAGKILSQPAGGKKILPRICQILKNQFLRYRNKQNYFHWQKYVDCNGSYFGW